MPDKNPTLGAKLAKLREERHERKARLDEQARKWVREQLASYDEEIEQVIGRMDAKGSSVAEIKRSYGTTNHRTIVDILERVRGHQLPEVEDEIFSYDVGTQRLDVQYVGHGPRHLTGISSYTVFEPVSAPGTWLFLPNEIDPENATASVLEDERANPEYVAEAVEFMDSLELSPEQRAPGRGSLLQNALDNGTGEQYSYTYDAEEELGGFETEEA